MKIIAYIQADIRYNKFLLKEYLDRKIIETTLENLTKCRRIDKIIIGLCDCDENRYLADKIKKYNNVDIIFSNIDDVNKRMITVLEKYDIDILLRVTGDQVFLNMDTIDKGIDKLIDSDYELFLPYGKNDSILCDIIKFKSIIKHKDEILKYDRYYKYYLENKKAYIYYMRYYCDELAEIWSFYTRSCNDYDLNKYFLSTYELVSMDSIAEFREEIMKSLQVSYGKNFLITSGWIKSCLFNKCINLDGENIPWYSYSAIEFIKDRLNERMDIFEFGCGGSTLWYSKLVRKIVSIEHNVEWYEKIKKECPKNSILKYIELKYEGEYCKYISNYKNKFDVVVIDGRDRVNCAKNCINSLKDDGVIIWDNSDRNDYKEGYNFLKQKGFKEIKFTGLGPSISEKFSTSIFYRESNCFNI